jgi:hypothetical protein
VVGIAVVLPGGDFVDEEADIAERPSVTGHRRVVSRQGPAGGYHATIKSFRLGVYRRLRTLRSASVIEYGNTQCA